jgi:hypothetical protein
VSIYAGRSRPPNICFICFSLRSRPRRPAPARAGSRLPQLRLIAPEFYEPLPYHASWTNVVLGYIASPAMGPHSRVKRDTLTPSEKAVILGDVPYENTGAAS